MTTAPTMPVAVANIADKIAHTILIEGLLHLELLELIARIYDQFLGLITLQQRLDVLLAEGTGATGD